MNHLAFYLAPLEYDNRIQFYLLQTPCCVIFIDQIIILLKFIYSILICTLTLAVSFGAVLLLPMSIGANEALIMFPNSYYLQWVNSSLILGKRRSYTILYFKQICHMLIDRCQIFIKKKQNEDNILVHLSYVSPVSIIVFFSKRGNQF